MTPRRHRQPATRDNVTRPPHRHLTRGNVTRDSATTALDRPTTRSPTLLRALTDIHDTIPRCGGCENFLAVVARVRDELNDVIGRRRRRPRAAAARERLGAWLAAAEGRVKTTNHCEVCVPSGPYERFRAALAQAREIPARRGSPAARHVAARPRGRRAAFTSRLARLGGGRCPSPQVGQLASARCSGATPGCGERGTVRPSWGRERHVRRPLGAPAPAPRRTGRAPVRRRSPSRRQQIARRRAAALAVLLAVLVILVVALSLGSSSSRGAGQAWAPSSRRR